MNLREFRILIYKSYKKIILTTAITSVLFGIFSYLLPRSFISEGSFILLPVFSVNEKVLVNQYNYDGYYVDQIAQSYSKTILGLIETPEFKKRVSDSLKIEPNFINLFSFNLNTNFKETAPRILVLSVKDSSKDLAEKRFELYSSEILNYSNKYNTDKKFKLERLDNFVFTYENTKSPFFYSLIGAFLGFSLCLSYLFMKELKK